MKAVDHAILTFFGQHHLELTPSNVARNIDYSQSYIRTRCKLLSDHGLLNRDVSNSDPFYSLSELGEQYLAGDLRAAELEDEE